MKKRIVFALLMGSTITGLVSFVQLCANSGMTGLILAHWLAAWFRACLVAIPFIYFFGPFFQRFVNSKIK
jgi:hypothetical protein